MKKEANWWVRRLEVQGQGQSPKKENGSKESVNLSDELTLESDLSGRVEELANCSQSYHQYVACIFQSINGSLP